MPNDRRRLRAVRAFQKAQELTYAGGNYDPVKYTIVFEALATELNSGGRHGLTPAVLSRVHQMPQETARRRLNSLVDEGYLRKDPSGYFLAEGSPYYRTFDKIVLAVEQMYGVEDE